MKKTISILLAIIMISISCINVFAAPVLTPYRDLEELRFYTEMYLSSTGMCKPFDFSDNRLFDALDNVSEVFGDSNATDEDYLSAYDTLLFADYNLNIDTAFAQDAYELALEEQNYNNWYTDEDWTDFELKRAALSTALATKLPSKITEAFYDMLYSYNVMTNRYTLKGDINKDGSVNVLDATLIQKYLVDRENLTGAQKMLTCAYNYEI